MTATTDTDTIPYQPILTYAPTPEDYGIPHPAFRPHQYDGLLWCEGVQDVGVIQAATGSGKSVFPAALSTSRRTACLTRTKSLQQQYAFYKGCILMGKSNYPCIHPDNDPGATCGDCLYDTMSLCEHVWTCRYLVQREAATAHRFPCINYSYWLASALFRKSPPETMVLDECHLASDITLDFAGIDFHSIDRATYHLPQFPSIRGSNRESIGKAIDWLVKCRQIMYAEYRTLKRKLVDGPNKKISRRMSALQNYDYSICATVDALRICPEAWFIRSGPQVGNYRGKTVPGIVIRPLTARYHFPRLFLSDKWKTILMSATVGDFDTFSRELGLNKKTLMTKRVPSNFPPSTRPIYVLDAPKMNYKSKEKDYRRQAEVMAEAIKACPPEWSGLIHTTRITEGRKIAERLVREGIDPDRLWTRPESRKWMGTQELVADWERFLARRRDAIAVSCIMQEGYDGVDIDMVFSSKVPFPPCNPGSYEYARMKYSQGFYNQRATWMFQQQQGRNRRGREGDYDTPERVAKFNACADMNIMGTRVQKCLDPDFLESLVT